MRHNGRIRMFVPKKWHISKYINKTINEIAEWLNNYPRLGGLAAIDVVKLLRLSLEGRC
jgi:hypothetical protein